MKKITWKKVEAETEIKQGNILRGPPDKRIYTNLQAKILVVNGKPTTGAVAFNGGLPEGSEIASVSAPTKDEILVGQLREVKKGEYFASDNELDMPGLVAAGKALEDLQTEAYVFTPE